MYIAPRIRREGMRTACAAMLMILTGAGASPAGVNYDESKVPEYTLPDPLIMQDGRKVAEAKVWNAGADGIYMFNFFDPDSPLWRDPEVMRLYVMQSERR